MQVDISVLFSALLALAWQRGQSGAKDETKELWEVDAPVSLGSMSCRKHPKFQYRVEPMLWGPLVGPNKVSK